MTKESLKKDIITTLGGYVAEKMIFGDHRTSSGVYADIQEASALANRAIRKYAMGVDPIHLAVRSEVEDAFVCTEKYAAEAIKIIKECEVEAENILQRNKLLLLKMSAYLTSHSKMEAPLIEEFVKKYGNEPWIQKDGLIHKKDYYKFNTTLQAHLNEFNDSETEVVFAKLIEEVEPQHVY
jgi:cell division protease FtsH